MATEFARTLRSLEQVRVQPLWLVLALALLLAWSGWLFGSSVRVYALSAQARLEVTRLVTRVSAPVGGRVVSLALELGREVQEQDVLVQIDSSAEQLHRAQLQSQLRGLQAQRSAVDLQIAAEEKVRSSRQRVNAADKERADLAVREARRAAGHQALLADVANRLHEREIVSSLEAEKAERELAERSSQTRGAEQEIRRLSAARYYDEDVALARIAELRSESVELQSRLQTAGAELAAADAELARYQVKAAARGRLGGIAPVRVGDVLREGDAIATVVPAADVQITGEFAASDAVGRIVPGQEARVRLTGFAWTDYGTIGARVSRVASEPSDGLIRVELRVDPDALGHVPLQHGLPGSVEIAVETVPPWTLLVRMLGRSLTGGNAPPASAVHAAGA